MDEEPIEPYVDLPDLISRNHIFVTNVIVAVACIGMACCVGILALVGVLPNNGRGMALLSVIIFLCLAGGFAFWSSSSDFYEPVEGFDCPHQKCKKYIAADDSWICGHCDSLNTPERPEEGKKGSSFDHWLTQCCRKCSRLPSSYLCHHCGEMIFLNAERNGQHPARAGGKAYPVSETVDVKLDWKAQIEEMVAEKMAFSSIAQKVCEMRDIAIMRIEEIQAMDQHTKNQLIEYEKQWANNKLQELKMQALKSK